LLAWHASRHTPTLAKGRLIGPQPQSLSTLCPSSSLLDVRGILAQMLEEEGGVLIPQSPLARPTRCSASKRCPRSQAAAHLFHSMSLCGGVDASAERCIMLLCTHACTTIVALPCRQTRPDSRDLSRCLGRRTIRLTPTAHSRTQNLKPKKSSPSLRKLNGTPAPSLKDRPSI